MSRRSGIPVTPLQEEEEEAAGHIAIVQEVFRGSMLQCQPQNITSTSKLSSFPGAHQLLDKMPVSELSTIGDGSVAASAPYVRGSIAASGSLQFIEEWNRDGDFVKWQWKMKAILMMNRVHTIVYDLDKLKPGISEQELEDMKLWALTILKLAMGEKVISSICTETSARDIWLKLEKLYLNKSPIHRLILLKKLVNYKMEEGASIESHLNKFNDLIMRMNAIDLKIEEEQIATAFLCSLPEKYDGLVNSLIYGHDTITLEDVKARLRGGGVVESCRV